MPNKPKAYRGDEPFVFVSYAHADDKLAYPLIAGLQERGLRIWFDEGIEAGGLWDEVIPDYVEQCAAMLCLVTTRFADSQNCKNEIRYGNELKKEVLILHLEDGEFPRYIRFHYSSIHALRLTDYTDRDRLLDKLAATEKLRCCLEQAQERAWEPEENPEELYQKGKVCYGANSYEEAVKWFRKAADLGNPEAMWYLGHCYHVGCGLSKSCEKAVMWYRRAADKGDVRAMLDIAFLYKLGDGVRRSDEEAAAWYRRAADMGDVLAMFHLSSCYAKGDGVPMNWKQAKYWRDKAKQTAATASKQ